MSQSPNTFFKIGPDSIKSTMASLSAGQRSAFQLLMFGSAFPLFFLGTGLPRPAVFLSVTFQMACVSGLLYMRWRLPKFRGSFLPFAVASITCLFALVASMIS